MKMARHTNRLLSLAVALSLGVLLLPRIAAIGADDMLGPLLFTVGTTCRDAGGQDWAFVAWKGTEASLLRDRAVAVYAKPGAAGAAAPYELAGIAQLARDTHTINLLLNRAVALGDDLALLEEHVDTLFEKIIPDESLSLEEKLATVLNAAGDDPGVYETLMLSAIRHPSLALCLGQAFAVMMSFPQMTFEARETTLPAADPGAVLGRVTVEAGQPVVLPPPQAVVEVPDPSPQGHLNVRLRWSMSPDLRRLALLHMGFNVYRMTQAFAEDPLRRYHINRPSGPALSALAEAEPDVVLANEAPVYPPAGGSPDEPCFIDDNGALGEPFHNGDVYYYFVTARDVLGRDGACWDACRVTICDRMPPPVPGGVEVKNIYTYEGGERRQALEVSWSPNENLPGDTTTAYVVYRWTNFADIAAHGGNPAYAHDPPSDLIPHDGEVEKLGFVDTRYTDEDVNRAFWYTVRAVDDSACDGGNYSGNSTPVRGVYRDWIGPAAPSGGVLIQCAEPRVRTAGVETPSAIGDASWSVACERLDPGILWAEFSYAEGLDAPRENATNFLGRYYFPGASNRVATVDLIWPDIINYITVFCRAGAEGDRESLYAPGVNLASSSMAWFDSRVTFTALTYYARGVAGADCDTHMPVKAGQDEIEPIGGFIQGGPDARSYRLYRTINGGEYQLIKATNFINYAEWLDETWGIVQVNAYICYYAQVFDEHGNPSPMVELGCFYHPGMVNLNLLKFTPSLPTPLLFPIQAAEDNGKPQMLINWFCPPAGVERFEISAATTPGAAPRSLSPQVSSNLLPPNTIMSLPGPFGKVFTLGFGKYRTPTLGVGFGQPGDAAYSLLVDVITGMTYTISVKAIGPSGRFESLPSAAERFRWNPVASPNLPEVPWPARGLPPVMTPSNASLAPVFFYKGHQVSEVLGTDQVGIRIGWVTNSSDDASDTLPGTNRPPADHLFPEMRLSSSALAPFVLYRYQVTNGLFPQVSGDVIQVSPLINQIAFAREVDPFLGPILRICDPFVRVLFHEGAGDPDYDIVAMDTQPVIQGASYRYIILQFDEQGEIYRCLLTSQINVPENP
ncbi:MAG: hypothetical protein KA248_06840 [Kiritimatiellae bacterium]|nr:hypothetical protein [Kiritimatiellia bacterium]